MRMPCSGAATFQHVDQTVVSVGPYRFHSAPRGPVRASSCSARSGGRPSPPISTLKPSWPCQPASISKRQVDGVACITVAWFDSSSARSERPSVASSRRASTTVAPTNKGSSSSSTAMSKLSVVTATSTSPGCRPGSRAMLARKLTTAVCGSTTPLGWPVEPEV